MWPDTEKHVIWSCRPHVNVTLIQLNRRLNVVELSKKLSDLGDEGRECVSLIDDSYAT